LRAAGAWAPAAAAFLAAAAAIGQPHVEPPEQILVEARSAPAARVALIAHARGAARRNAPEAARALTYAGWSFERSGLADSAAACYREAAGLGVSNVERLALVDLLLARGRAPDLLEAYRMVSGMTAATPPGAFDRSDVMLRAMWVQHLAGHADSAVRALDELGPAPKLEGRWALRAARVLLEDAGRPAPAVELLLPLELRSRSQDPEIHELLLAGAGAFGRSEAEIERIIEADLARRDEAEEVLLQSLDARRLPLRAADGFLLSSVVRPAAPGAPAAIVLSMGDTLAHYDSLIVHLHEAGFAVMVLEPRGHGASVGPACPNPMRWEGREHALEEQLARDAAYALGALGELGPVDTTRALVVGAGFTAHAAVRAAELRPEFRAIVLASAEPALVDRGMMLAAVERTRRPMFLQTAPEDLVDLYYFSDALYQAGERRISRVSSGVATGRYAEQFRSDPLSGARLRQWLVDLRSAWAR
jgi:hypothetical protein